MKKFLALILLTALLAIIGQNAMVGAASISTITAGKKTVPATGGNVPFTLKLHNARWCTVQATPAMDFDSRIRCSNGTAKWIAQIPENIGTARAFAFKISVTGKTSISKTFAVVQAGLSSVASAVAPATPETTTTIATVDTTPDTQPSDPTTTTLAPVTTTTTLAPPVIDEGKPSFQTLGVSTWSVGSDLETSIASMLTTSLPVPASTGANLGTMNITSSNHANCDTSVTWDLVFACNTFDASTPTPWIVTAHYSGATYTAVNGDTIVLDPELAIWQVTIDPHSNGYAVARLQ